MTLHLNRGTPDSQRSFILYLIENFGIYRSLYTLKSLIMTIYSIVSKADIRKSFHRETTFGGNQFLERR